MSSSRFRMSLGLPVTTQENQQVVEEEDDDDEDDEDYGSSSSEWEQDWDTDDDHHYPHSDDDDDDEEEEEDEEEENSVEPMDVDGDNGAEKQELPLSITKIGIESETKDGIAVKATAKGEESNKDDDPDCICCSICLEPWSSAGNHIVSCLPCGHLFGLSCINRWIQQSKRKYSKCPKCKSKCALKDVIRLYVNKVSVADDIEQEEERFHRLQALMEKVNQTIQRRADEQDSKLEATIKRIEENERRIEANSRSIEEQDRTIKLMRHDLQRTIEEQNSKIEANSETLEANDRKIKELTEALKENDSRFKQMIEAIVRQNEQIRLLKELASHRHSAPQQS